MIVVVDERPTVTEGYASWFDKEGVSACGLAPCEFEGWVSAVSEADMRSIEAFVLGTCDNRGGLAKVIRHRSSMAAIIAPTVVTLRAIHLYSMRGPAFPPAVRGG